MTYKLNIYVDWFALCILIGSYMKGSVYWHIKYISQKFQQLKEFAFGQTLHILIPETWQNDRWLM